MQNISREKNNIATLKRSVIIMISYMSHCAIKEIGKRDRFCLNFNDMNSIFSVSVLVLLFMVSR